MLLSENNFPLPITCLGTEDQCNDVEFAIQSFNFKTGFQFYEYDSEYGILVLFTDEIEALGRAYSSLEIEINENKYSTCVIEHELGHILGHDFHNETGIMISETTIENLEIECQDYSLLNEWIYENYEI